jgi:NRAMP (natural resistance-associated macrophage protein)-like metal ion transporter
MTSNTTQHDSHSLGNVHNTVSTENKTGWRKLLSFLGPAYLVSVGYMDPGNWATDLAAGSQFRYRSRVGFGAGIKTHLPALCKLLPIHIGADSHHSLRPGRDNRYGNRLKPAFWLTADMGGVYYSIRYFIATISAQQRHA